MARLDFDASTVEPAQPLDVIPAGKYICQITQSEMKATKGSAGQYLWLELSILDGEFANRKLFDQLNLVNSNQKAVDIARRQLSALTGACGLTYLTDSEELHMIPIEVTVRVRPPQGNYDASNEVRGYAPVNGQAPRPTPAPDQAAPAPQRPAPAPAQAAPAPQRPAAGGSTPPWRRSA